MLSFTKDSGDEITLKYKIGKGRKFYAKYLTCGCEDNQVIDVNFTAANSTTPLDASFDELELTLDKGYYYGSNAWYPSTRLLSWS